MGTAGNTKALWRTLYSVIFLLSVVRRTLSQGCATEVPLGLESGAVPNERIFCSRGDNPCFMVRPTSGGWYTTTSDGLDYMRIDLGVSKRVTGLELYRGYGGAYVSKFKLFYSDDGLVWQGYLPPDQSAFEASELEGISETLEPITFGLGTSGIRARYVAINPVKWVGSSLAMKLELLGCELDTPFVPSYTNVSGVIQADQTWSLANSPYLLTGETNIAAGVTVRVEQGVRIVFIWGRVNIHGSLVSIRHNSTRQRTLFSGQKIHLDQFSTRWDGLRVQDGGRLTLENADIIMASLCLSGEADSIRLSQVTVAFCPVGVKFSDGSANNNTVSLRGVTVRNSITGVSISATPAKPYVVMESTTVSFHERYAVRIVSSDVVLIAKEVTIHNNTVHGIAAANGPFRILMENSLLQDNVGNGIFVRTSPSAGSVTVRVHNSTFIRNGHGIFVSPQQGRGEWEVEDSVFVENVYSGMRYDVYARITPSETVRFQNNRFINNGKEGDSCALCFNGNYQIEGTYIVEGNVFVGNAKAMDFLVKHTLDTPTLRVHIKNNLFSASSSSYAVFLDVENLEFFNNTISGSSGGGMRIQRVFSNRFFFNKFDNPVSPYNVEILTPFSEDNVVNLTYNFWGSSDPNYIAEKIKGFYQNVDFAISKAFPAYIDSELTQLYFGEVDVNFAANSESVGGKLEGNFTTPRNCNLRVTRSIWVSANSTLTILPGCRLHFLPGRGILMHGTLIAVGELFEPIVLAGADGEEWAGTRLMGPELFLRHVTFDRASIPVHVGSENGAAVTFIGITALAGSTVLDVIAQANVSLDIKESNFTANRAVVKVNLSPGSHLTLSMSKCRVVGSRGHAIQIIPSLGLFSEMRANIELRDSRFMDTDSVIFLTSNYDNLKANLKIANCIATGYKRAAVKAQAWIDGFQLENCDFSSEGVSAINLFFINRCTERVYIRNSRFYGLPVLIDTKDNTQGFNCPIHISGNVFHIKSESDRSGVTFYSSRFPSAQITDNEFIGGKGFGLELSVFAFMSSLKIANNIFRDGAKAFDFYSEQRLQTEITGNHITDLTGSPVVLLEPIGSQTPKVDFSRNVLRNNSNSKGSVLEVRSPSINMNHNTIINPATRFNVRFNKAGFSSQVMDMTNNRWGTSDLASLGETFWDKGDNRSLPAFQITPVLGSGNIGPSGDIGGVVRSELILTESGSPYIVESDLEVAAVGMLVIDAGVELLFSPGKQLIVKGLLLVQGTEELPVSFSPRNLDQKWKGVAFRQAQDAPLSRVEYLQVTDTAEGILLEGTPVQLDYVTSDYSDYDGFTFRWSSNDIAVTMNGIKARNNSFSGIYFALPGNEQSLNMKNCELQGNTASNMEVVNTKADLVLNGCVISDSKIGIRVEGRPSGLMEIDSNEFHGNEKAMNVLSHKGAMGSIEFKVVNNYIHRHSTGGSVVDTSVIEVQPNSNMEQNTWIITGNNLTNNLFNRYILEFDTTSVDNGPLNLVIAHNSFELNYSPILRCALGYLSQSVVMFVSNYVTQSFSAESAVYVEEIVSANTVKIRSNTFMNNTGYNVVWFKSSQQSPRYDVDISHNVFVENRVLNVVFSQALGGTVNDNVFMNPLADCELKTGEFNEFGTVTARRNYWGYSNLINITRRMCAFEGDMTLTRVEYFPYRLSPDLSGPMSQNFSDFYIDGSFGGAIQKNTFVASGLYDIQRSIYVEEGAILTVEEGAELRFPKKMGIYAKGLVIFGEEKGRAVKLSPLSENWYGVVLPWSEARENLEDIRLANGPYGWTGRLEYKTRGVFGTVCDRDFDEKDAMVACRELGYSHVDKVEVFGYAYDGPGEGPIVFAGLDCKGTESSLRECPASGASCSHDNDVSVSCIGTAGKPLSAEYSRFNNVTIEGSLNGVQVNTLTVTFSSSRIVNTEGSGLTLGGQHNTFDMGGTVIEQSGKHGIDVKVEGSIAISNVFVERNKMQGIHIAPKYGVVELSRVTARGNLQAGLRIAFRGLRTPDPQGVIVRDSLLLDHEQTEALIVVTESSSGPSLVRLEDNIFSGNSYGSMSVAMRSRIIRNPANQGQVSLEVVRNTFTKGGPNSILIYDYVSAKVEENVFLDNNADSGCLLVLTASRNRGHDPALYPKSVNVINNAFYSNKGVCVAELVSENSDRFNGRFDDNMITNNTLSIASLILSSGLFGLRGNTFNNSNTDIEVKVEVVRSAGAINGGTIFASNNVWESTDTQTIQGQIYDGNDDSSLFVLLISSAPRTSSTMPTSTTTTTMAPTTASTKGTSTPTSTSAHTTSTTTKAPTTSTTTVAPTTSTTTMAPTASTTTRAPTTSTTTMAPTTSTKTMAPTTSTTTMAPTASTTTMAPTTSTTTRAPTTSTTTMAPTTSTTTMAPTTSTTTMAPTTSTTTMAPTTSTTTMAPTTSTTTMAPTTSTTTKVPSTSVTTKPTTASSTAKSTTASVTAHRTSTEIPVDVTTQSAPNSTTQISETSDTPQPSTSLGQGTSGCRTVTVVSKLFSALPLLLVALCYL